MIRFVAVQVPAWADGLENEKSGRVYLETSLHGSGVFIEIVDGLDSGAHVWVEEDEARELLGTLTEILEGQVK